MPEAIASTILDGSDAAKKHAFSHTGYSRAEDWCDAHWNSKWNSLNTRVSASQESIYDLTFLTPWETPVPVLEALASSFPRLYGSVFVLDEAMEWGEVGLIRDGEYSSASTSASFELECIVHGAGRSPEQTLATSRAIATLIPTARSLRVGNNEDATWIADDRIWETFLALKHHLPDYIGRLEFEKDVHTSVLQLMSGANARLAPGMFRQPEHYKFFASHDRCRTWVDQRLIVELASCLKDEAGVGSTEDALAASWRNVASQAIANLTEDELFEWVALAMYRPGISIGAMDKESLAGAVLEYAMQLRCAAILHLRKCSEV